MIKQILRTKLLWALIFGMLCAAHPAFAEDSVQELKKQVAELQAKVAELESRQNSVPAQAAAPAFPAMMQNNMWDPFAEMQNMNNQMQQMFSRAFDQSFSPQNGMFSGQMFFDDSRIEETKDGYVIKLNTAGFDNDKVNISVNGNSISISGEYKAEEKNQGKNTIFESHNYGKFLNTIPLPKDADTSKMKTEKKGDQLEIYLPKKT